MRICVIGAGPTGLTTVKNLAEAGLTEMICHEAQDQTGGIWAYSDDPARPSVYRSAHTISSRRLSQFPDFPMPAGYPDYPSNRQILDYMRAYEAKFGLGHYIRLNSRVTRAERRPGGGWVITAETPSGSLTHTADYLMVCSGHHRKPFRPELAGRFSGTQLHAGEFKRSEPFAGQRVLVVGGGNSACDIAAALSRVADHVSLSIRSPQVIVPKLVGGRPLDVQFAKLHKPYFRWARDKLLKLGLAILVGPYEQYGLKRPSGSVLSHHPTLNSDILDRIRHGTVTVRPGVARADGETVWFEDGSEGGFDSIIWATGYTFDAPFLGEVCAGWDEGARPPLYLKMIPADPDDLYFIGLIQPIGCIWVLADLQARVAAAEIAGAWRRPADIAARIEQELKRDARRYKASPRHAVQVDTHEYSTELKTILEAANPGLPSARPA